jgi:hypothetical protein
MTEPSFTHPLRRQSRRAALVLTCLIAVGSLSGVGVATARARSPAASEAAADLAPIIGSPAVLKASPKLFDRSGAAPSISSDGMEAYSLTRSPEGFVQKVREARGAGGD